MFSHKENFDIDDDPSEGMITISLPLEDKAKPLPCWFKLGKNSFNREDY